MTHIRHQQDADLHDENGEHISTSPSTAGHMIENFERRIRYHLHCHAVEGDGYNEDTPDGGRRFRPDA